MDLQVETFVRLAVEPGATATGEPEVLAAWTRLNPDQKKQARESQIFIEFSRTCKVVSDPFAHSNEKPPLPDIRLLINNCDSYFELGEIVSKELAESISVSQRQRSATGSRVSLIDPLTYILASKCGKTYPTNEAPVELLLYYWRHYPDEATKAAIFEHLARNRESTEQLVQQSQFERVWIYDWHSKAVFWNYERSAFKAF